MKLMPLLAIPAMAMSSLQGSRSFSDYVSRSQWIIPAPEVAALGKVCGSRPEGTSPRYAVFYDEKWVARTDLKAAGDDAEFDSYQTIEIWHGTNQSKLVALWDVSADTVDEDELIACIAPSGALVELVSTHTRTRPDSGSLEWRFNRQMEFAQDGHRLSESSGFITYRGRPALAPKLESRELQSMNAPVDPSSITKMLRQIEAEIRNHHAAQK